MGRPVLGMAIGAAMSGMLLSAAGAWAAEDSAERASSPSIYVAPLQAVNVDVNRMPASGAAIFVRQGDQLNAYVRVVGLAPGMMHRQMIHIGGECPTSQADKNEDGVVDVIEGVPSYGLVLIPLDDNLTQVAENRYPRTGEEDRLEYAEIAAFDELERNTSGEDKDPEDPIVKLKEGEPLDLAGKTVVIHGVAEDTPLPDSVKGVADVAPHLTVPVACGVIEELG